MANEAKHITTLQVVKDLDPNSFNAVQHALIVKPAEINEELRFWREEQKNAQGVHLELCKDMINSLINIRVKCVNLTKSVYDITSTEEKPVEDKGKQKPVEGFQSHKKEEPQQKNNPQQNYEEKKNNENKKAEIAEKFKEFVLSVDALKLKLTESEKTKEECAEIAKYILGEGKYIAKNPKKWSDDKCTHFVDSIFLAKEKKETKEVEKKETTNSTEKQTVPTKEEQTALYKKLYGEFENKFSLDELTAKIREIIQENKIAEPVNYITGLVTYILTGGYYTDKKDETTPREWTAESIAKYIDVSLVDLSSDISEPGTSEADNKSSEETIEPDFTMAKAINHINMLIHKEGKSEEDIIKWLGTNIVIEKFSDEAQSTGFDSAYNKFFKTIVTGQISLREEKAKEKAKKNNPEVIQEILNNVEKDIIENKEKVEKGEDDFTVGSLVIKVRNFFREKGVELEGGMPAVKAKILEIFTKNSITAKIVEKKAFEETAKTDAAKPAEVEKPKTDKSATAKEEKIKKQAIVIDLNSFDGSKFPELKAEVDACNISDDASKLLQKYENDHEKLTVISTLLYIKFSENKIYGNAEKQKKNESLNWKDDRIRSFINMVTKRTDTSVKKAETKNQPAAAEEKVEAPSTSINKGDSKENSDSTADKKDDKSGEENQPADATTDQNTADNQQKSTAGGEKADKKADKPAPKYLALYPEIDKANNTDKLKKAVKTVITRMVKEENISFSDACVRLVDVVIEFSTEGSKKCQCRNVYKGQSFDYVQNAIQHMLKDLKITSAEDLNS